ncbi:hypothetical protein QAD02_005502 [Eretmocerus hayati]|uniref:Uncharacterized protein n=1 Tax=Eretmocerus hayati TaxID=131215 RepID=A0ACC2NSQ4_9HYME|nr:hypothetical protein QAD02_005502 [Eretmocerus hayati]
MQDPLQSNSPSKPPQLKREHDSSDDFEHLEHELQMHHHNSAAVKNDSPPPLFHQNGQQPPHQPLLDFGDSFGLSTNDAPLQQQHQQQTLGSLSSPGLLDNLLDDEDDEVGGGLVKPVPATPPPSADLEAAGLTSFADSNNHQKYNQGNEQFLNKKFDLDDLAVDDPMGAKASHTFVQNERRNFEVKRDDFSASPTYPSTGGGFDDDDDDDNSQLILGYKKHQIPEPNKNTPPALGQDNDDDEDDDTEPERSQSLGTPAHKPSNTNNIPANNKLGLDEDFDDDSLILVNKPSQQQQQQQHQPPKNLYDFEEEQEHHRVISSKLPEPEKSPELDFVKEEILVQEATKEKPVPWTMKAELEDAMMGAPTKPLPPPPVDDEFLAAETGNRQHRLSGGASDTGDSEFESEQEASPARSIGGKVQPPPVQVTKPQIGDVHERKTFIPPKNNTTTTSSTRQKSRDEDEIAPKAIFRDIGIGE